MILDDDNIELTKHSFKHYTKETWTGSNGRDSRIGLLKLFFIVLLMVVVVRFLYSPDNSYMSSMSFLEMLQNLPSVSTSFKSFSEKLLISSDWGVFNFLRDFFNVFSNLASIITWVASSVIDVLIFIVAFLRYLFI